MAGLSTFAQTTLFQDDFESGTSQWALNTGSGANSWVVNNTYLGFSGLIPDTPNQPASITNGPQSSYMHITNTTICGGLSVCNANFDTGSASNQNSEVATSIDASSYTNVTVSFWYLCAGQTGVSYGTMEYSIDGGTTWIGTGTEYSGVSSWTQESVSLPAWDNSGSFKVRFKWQNGGGGLDPAFSIDELLITGTAGSVATVSTDNSFAPNNWCYDDVVSGNVGFVAIGTFNAGNIFTAELSDASGSFAAPTTIGTISSTSSGSLTVPVTISAGTLAGTGYRIRVNSSAPSATGADNGTDLIIHDLPVVSMGALTSVCDNSSSFTLAGGLPIGGVYSGTGVATGSFDPSISGPGSHAVTYTYVDMNGCQNTANQSITVYDLPVVTLGTYTSVCDYTPVFALTGGLPTGGVYSGTGVLTGSFDPGSASIGTHSIVYSYIDANNCENSATQSIVVDGCLGVEEFSSVQVTLYPNPANMEFSISGTNADRVELIDNQGKLIKVYNSQNENYSLENVQTGVYTVLIYSNTSRLTTKLVVN